LARFLALDWDHKQLHVVAATVSGGNVRIQRAAVWAEPQSPNPAEAEALGKLLRERLKQAGIAPAPVLACLGRDRVILKEVRYPAVAAAEEPALVRFQAVKELTEPADEVVIDYVPVGNGGNGERRALVLIVRREMLQAYQALCQAAGLKLAALTPRPYGTAACLSRLAGDPGASSAFTAVPPPPAGAGPATVAVVTVAEHWAEFCVLRGGSLVFARALGVGPGLAGEVRRSLIVHAGQAPQHPVTAVYLAGNSEHSELRERLQDLLDLPVHAFDPFARVERPEMPTAGRGAFSGAVGLLYAQADRAGLPINFVRVKQAQQTADPNRRRLVIAAALAGVLLLGGVAWCFAQLNAADVELAGLSAKNTELDQELLPVEETGKYLKGVGDWVDGGVVWLDEIYELVDRFPDNPNLRLTELQCIPQAAGSKDKHVGSIILTGITTDDQFAKELAQRLDEDSRHYRIHPLDITSNNTGLDVFRQFRRKFTLRIDVEKRPPSEYKRKLTPPASEQPAGNRPRGGRGNAAPEGFGGEAP
jgi:Tfp pilus assembly PilM family ATPase